MRIFHLCLLLCVAHAFAPSYLADLPTRDAGHDTELERKEDLSPVEQETDSSGSRALPINHLPPHESTRHDSTAVVQTNSEGIHDRPPTDNQEHSIARRDVGVYIAVVRDGGDIEKFRDFLKTKAEDGNKIYQIGPDDNILGYGNVTLTPNSKADVENYEGTLGLLPDSPMTFNRAVQTKRVPPGMHENVEPTEKRGELTSTDLKWKIQEYADEALVMDSQYDGKSLDGTVDFVYPENAGEGVFVYVIEWGIQIKVKNKDNKREFKTDDDRVLQTRNSVENNASPDTDDNTMKPSHGTQMASKAVGKKFGLAKEATLVSTKVYPISGDWENAMWLVLRDIKSNEGRASRSVVTTSLALGEGMTSEQAKSEMNQKLYGNDLRKLSNLGVPFVAASGNEGRDPNRNLVDQVPMVFQDDDIPLIIVGASDYDGKRADYSQTGPLVTVYAPGSEVDCQTKVDGQHGVASGTSLAAPQVAGLIATYLSYSTKPWDDTKTGVDRVKAIRDYVTSEHSSWVRDPASGIRVIWNGANKAAHGDDDDDDDDDDSSNNSNPPAPSPVASPTPSRKGKALSIVYQYVRDTISNDNSWLFFKSDYGTSSVCHPMQQAMRVLPAGGDTDLVNNPPWPGGTYKMNDLIKGVECDYLNNGANSGALFCQDWDAPPPKAGEGPLPKNVKITCKEEVKRWVDGAEICSEGGDNFVAHHPVVSCDW